MPTNNNSNLTTVYKEVCNRLNAIDDFRSKMLGLLPLVSGTGLFILFRFKSADWQMLEESFGQIGTFGILITIGLLFYEIRGIQNCLYLQKVGLFLEQQMVVTGQFHDNPSRVLGIIGKTAAAQVIYPAVLAGWSYVAVYKACLDFDKANVALINGVFGLLIVILYFIKARKRVRDVMAESKATVKEAESKATFKKVAKAVLMIPYGAALPCLGFVAICSENRIAKLFEAIGSHTTLVLFIFLYGFFFIGGLKFD